MNPISALASVEPESAASLATCALAIRRRDPEAAVARAARAAAVARDEGDPALERRGLATPGPCLPCLPAELSRAREVLRDALGRCEEAEDDALRCEVLA